MWQLLFLAILVVTCQAGLPGGAFRSLHLNGGSKSSDNREQYQSTPREREQLYSAYNDLHTLAQEFQKPFDAPAVIVVGHQTSGKSALIEALMGFQFNQVRSNAQTAQIHASIYFKNEPSLSFLTSYSLSLQQIINRSVVVPRRGGP